MHVCKLHIYIYVNFTYYIPYHCIIYPQLEGEKWFGRIGFIRYPIPAVQVYDPELAEKALRNQGATPSRGIIPPWQDYRKERAEKMGLLISEGEEWKKSR